MGTTTTAAGRRLRASPTTIRLTVHLTVPTNKVEAVRAAVADKDFAASLVKQVIDFADKEGLKDVFGTIEITKFSLKDAGLPTSDASRVVTLSGAALLMILATAQ